MSTKNSLTPTKQYKLILSAVHMVYRLVNSTYNFKELSLRLTRLLCQFITARSATVYILDPQTKKVTLIASFNNKINILKDRKKDLAKIPRDVFTVVGGQSIIQDRMIGLPLVADETVGAIFIHRRKSEKPFKDFDCEMLSVFVEQSVTAIRNLQLNEQHQKTILESIKFIGKMMEKQKVMPSAHTPVYSKIIYALAEKLELRESDIELLQYAGILHAAGAVDVPFEILSKRSQLTPEEFKIIRDLPSKSAALIKPVDFLKPVLPIILYHRERYDGTGYPSGLKKEQIPPGARIMAVVDAFDAMLQGRPYKRALSVDEAVTELRRNSGTQFDPKIVQAFYELAKQKNFRKLLKGKKA